MIGTAEQRLEKLTAKIEQVLADVEAGKQVDMRALDAESLAVHKQMKGKPDPKLQPLLSRAINALERITRTLEQRIDDLKTNGK